MTRHRPRLYFSFRSPYSWMAVHHMRTVDPDIDSKWDWVPLFEPDLVAQSALVDRGIELPYTTMSKAKHLYILQDTKRLTQRMGLSMRWPIDVDPWWALPHHAYLAARHAGRASAFYDAVVAARWERGEDICTPEVIRGAATEAGLDPEVVVNSPNDLLLREEGIHGLNLAYQDDVFGLPFFKVGRHKFWGLDRVDEALTALNASTPAASVRETDALAGIPLSVLETVGALDHDTAGGCG